VKRAHDALTQAGHSPEVIKVYGFGQLADMARGRREVRRLTGQSFVPVLLLDDGEYVTGSDETVGWAGAHPAAGS
jgi:hypothetical protein